MMHYMTSRQIRKFASMLDWQNLKEMRHVMDTETEIVWYESVHGHNLLQINTIPCLCGCVFALRSRICSGWHEIAISGDTKQIREEAARLSEWLHRSWFELKERRREYRSIHPECANYTQSRLREDGPPYNVGE
jgi:hypothetical protein